MLSYKARVLNALTMKTKLYIFIILFLGCSYSPWETEGTIKGKDAKYQLSQLLRFYYLAQTPDNSREYNALCGKQIHRIINTAFPQSINDDRLYKVDSVKECKRKIHLYAALVLGYAVNVDGCIFSRTITTLGKYDCHIEEADTFQLGKNGFS